VSDQVDEPTDEARAERVARSPEFSHVRRKHGVVGPFGGRQLLVGALAVAGVVTILVLATRPLGTTDQTSPRDPRATPFILGAAPANGLRPGDRPPELLGAAPTTQTTDPAPLALIGIGAVTAALAFVIFLPPRVGFAGPPGRARWPWRLVFAGTFALVLVFAGASMGLGRTSVPTGPAPPLTDLQGRPVQLSDLRGRGVWINFWASWCPPCQAETPVLRDVYRAYESHGLTVLGISVQESNVADVSAYAARYGLTFDVAADLSGDVFRAYKIYALPTQLFVGPDGVIRSVVYGPLTREQAVAHVEQILPSP
jgi:peroxiredoxin